MPRTEYSPCVLVDTSNLPEAEWLEWRRKGIGGSDAAAILGISPFATARDLYYGKLKILPFEEGEDNWVAKKMGHLLEDLVAEIFAKKTGYRIFQVKKMFHHPDYPSGFQYLRHPAYLKTSTDFRSLTSLPHS